MSVGEEEKIVFVTVGTTQFNALIEVVCQESFLHQLKLDGFTKVILQYGRGRAPSKSTTSGITMEYFDFAPSLQSYMSRACVILCHAGAGSIMEALSLQKHTIVVINNDLMDNHQLELAQALQRRNHIAVIPHPNLLLQQWNQVYTTTTTTPLSSTNNTQFITQLHQHMGFPI